MKVLFIGDIVGEAGVAYTREVLADLLPAKAPDLVIANAENAVNGRGLSERVAESLYDAGVELITLGNHAFDQRGVEPWLHSDSRVVRPANYPPGAPGRGYTVCQVKRKPVLLINLLGRAFMAPVDCPFQTVDGILAQGDLVKHVIVDMHAEATSEKLAMGWHLTGRVSAVIGTHTHVQTADQRILPPGTAYLTDAGMVGPLDGILGMARTSVIHKLRTQLPTRFAVADGPRQFNAVCLELDDESGKAVGIERIYRAEAP